MAAIVKETVTADENSVTHAVTSKEDSTTTWVRLLYYLLGVIEVLLAFRFVFRLTAANPGSSFVALIYEITLPLTLPFSSIFGRVSALGSVMEPSTLVAMAVYAVIVYAIANLSLILSRKPETEI